MVKKYAQNGLDCLFKHIYKKFNLQSYFLNLQVLRPYISTFRVSYKATTFIETRCSCLAVAILIIV